MALCDIAVYYAAAGCQTERVVYGGGLFNACAHGFISRHLDLKTGQRCDFTRQLEALRLIGYIRSTQLCSRAGLHTHRMTSLLSAPPCTARTLAAFNFPKLSKATRCCSRNSENSDARVQVSTQACVAKLDLQHMHAEVEFGCAEWRHCQQQWQRLA